MVKDCHDYEDKLFDLSNLLHFMIYLPFIDYHCNELERMRRWTKTYWVTVYLIYETIKFSFSNIWWDISHGFIPSTAWIAFYYSFHFDPKNPILQMKNSLVTFLSFTDISIEIYVTVKRRWTIQSEFNTWLAGLHNIKHMKDKHKWFNESCKVHYHMKCQLSNSLYNICQRFPCDIHEELSLNHTSHREKKFLQPEEEARRLSDVLGKKGDFPAKNPVVQCILASTNFLCKIAIFYISSKWNYSISRWHLRALISL